MTTPLTAVDTTLDEIFGYECSGRDCPHEISGKHYILDDEAKQEVKALIGTIAEQIIGEDEDLKNEFNELMFHFRDGKNKLRAEQRQRLKDYMENKQ